MALEKTPRSRDSPGERQGAPNGPRDEALIRRSLDGDLCAFEALYRRYAARTHAICLRMTGEPQAAEDLTQEVWIRVWEKLPGFRGESRFSSWLHRLTANLTLDQLRKDGVRNRRLRIVEDPDTYERVGRNSWTGTRMDLEAAIATLPPGARTVFVLYEIEGYLHREIAELTGTAEGTVKAQLHRARRLLREALQR